MKAERLVGIDEVGRGPLAGPVTLCACVVASDFDFSHFTGIRDSKKLSAQKREEWLEKIIALKERGELDFALVSVEAHEIDSSGISSAIKKAVAGCLEKLALDPALTKVFLDGSLHAPTYFIFQETIIKGDDKVSLISAASIVAKVMRDRHMEDMGRLYPAYGFEKHKGYGTMAHLAAIKKLGILPLHRRSFLKNL